MAKRPTIKVYPTHEQKQRIKAEADRLGLSVSDYLVKAGTRDTPQPKAEAQVRILSLLERGVQSLEQIADDASEARGDVESLLLLRRLDALSIQLGEITDMIAEARR